MSLNQPFESAILPVLPLRDMVVFPNSITPLFVVRPRSIAALDEAIGRDKLIFTTLQRNVELDTPATSDLQVVGTVAEVLQVLRVPDGSAKVLIEGNYVARAVEYTQGDKLMQALTVRVGHEELKGNRARAMMRIAMGDFETYARLSEKIPEDLLLTIRKIEDAAALTNAIAHYVQLKTDDKQRILESNSIEEKFMLLHSVMEAENQILELEAKIVSQVKSQIGRSQREYFLNEQLKAIERELGVNQEEESEIAEMSKAIKKADMPKEARERAEKELRRFTRMAPLSPEATVTRSYVEWLTEVPWKKATKDKLQLDRAKKILDAEHYGLEKIKERILDYLAVLQMAGTGRGPILCFVGPPGVGKTSLGRSVANCLGREFVRVSLGGVRDEAEIRGHRRTYIGALPGKIIQQMRKAGTVNPVFLLDEIDKMSSDFRGDPASALLEVLDPEQNKAFNDHYLEVDYDLSNVMFITTANTMEGIPHPLLDRMEVIRLAGYTDIEKKHIATKFLVPKQVKEAGLKKTQIRLGVDGLRTLISGYTKEAGVRSLEREIGAVARKTVRRILEKPEKERGKASIKITPDVIKEMLGPVKYHDNELERHPEVGVALGLAWTSVGGELLPVETSWVPGKGGLMLTGKLGEVMQESAKTALSYLRGRAGDLGIAVDIFKDADIHVHIPEGAIPKDGPSAGITLATSIASALSRRAVRQDVAMTGEMTLRGKVLKIGGLKEKALAAHRFGIRTIIIPADNQDDLLEIPKEIATHMKFVQVRHLNEVLEYMLAPMPKDPAGKPRRSRRSGESDSQYVSGH
jgi:ATP-dependent Lon protease